MQVVIAKFLADDVREAKRVEEAILGVLAKDALNLISIDWHQPTAEELKEIEAAGYDPDTGDSTG